MHILSVSAVILLCSAAGALAAPQSYQASGQVLEVTDKAIVISNAKENLRFQRNEATRLPADVTVGSRVTVEYSMTALEVTDKSPRRKDKKAK